MPVLRIDSSFVSFDDNYFLKLAELNASRLLNPKAFLPDIEALHFCTKTKYPDDYQNNGVKIRVAKFEYEPGEYDYNYVCTALKGSDEDSDYKDSGDTCVILCGGSQSPTGELDGGQNKRLIGVTFLDGPRQVKEALFTRRSRIAQNVIKNAMSNVDDFKNMSIDFINDEVDAILESTPAYEPPLIGGDSLWEKLINMEEIEASAFSVFFTGPNFKN
ncbi:hypothetical protein [Lewinella sp. W8]|uniref:hypothetical protein n=1 Tax=Lewinella sp. W8 TaxID=2528208 RepID=UPI0010681D2C|nr:hypothetical protein [Lewinella sp. W8]MTB49986.1 hypothetical protein [Lewinella sp. W8]